MAYFVAFYSYKGGVGRSLALSNVAYSLAERGKRVVLVDMDLEAPNLHSVPEFAFKGSGAKKGFVEYADSYRRTGKCPAIGSYVHRSNKSPGTGELWLMPAGQFGAEYQPKLASLSWRKLHPRKGTEPFIDELRKALTEEIQPHYVLIDSRTGLSDIGGLSTHRLADMVVLVFNLTRSCMEGSIRTYRSFVSDVSRIQTVQLLASPVPPALPGAESIVKSRLDQAVKLMPQGVAFGRELIQIAYDPAMVLMEELPVRHPDLPAAKQYEDLREAIQRANPEEVFPVVEQAVQFRSEGRLEDGLGLIREFIKANPRNAEAYLALGSLLFEANRAREAANDFRSARDLEPGLALVHRRLGEALVVEEQAAEAVEALKQAEKLGDHGRELYVALTRAYGQLKEPAKELEARRRALTALLGSPDRIGEDTSALPELRRGLVQVLRRRPPYQGFDAEAFWGQVMGSLSMSLQEKTRLLRDVLEGALETKSLRTLLQSLEEENQSWLEILGSNAPELQKRVAESFVDITQEEAAVQLRREDVVDAALLGLLACQTNDPRRRCNLFEEATRIDPSNAALLFGLGTSLVADLAPVVEQEERKSLYLQAASKYQEAIRIKPDDHEALLYNWGNTLADLAGLAEGEERKDLFQQAGSKYQEAIRIKADKHEALNNWGNALAALAGLAEGEERKDLFQQAGSKYQEAIRIRPDSHEALYNWGITLAALAPLADGEERKDLFQQAGSKYQEAIRIKPDKHEAFNNWGNTLAALAGLAEGEERKDLFQQAASKYQEAIRIKPDDHEALYNWGVTLAALARLAEGEERKDLFQQAGSKYQEVIRIKPDKHEALNNWSSALLSLVPLESEEEAVAALCVQAVEKARKANEIQPGSGDYNLACVLSRLGEFSEAADLVKARLHRDPEMRGHALDDPDLQPLWAARPDLREAIEKELAAPQDDQARSLSGGSPDAKG